MFSQQLNCFLNDELVARILSALPAASLVQAEATCKRWQRLAADYALWPKLFTRSLAESSFKTVPKQANMYALQQDWKLAYSTLVTIAVQLHHRYQTQTSLKVRYLKGHKGAVICLAACGNIIASGSTDQTVRVWDKRNGTCVHILRFSSRPHAIHMLTEHLLLVRYTTTILLWKGSSVHRTFSVGQHIIDSTIFDHLMFITTAASNSVEVWDIYSGLRLRIVRVQIPEETDMYVSAGVMHGKQVLLVGLDSTVCFLDQASGETLKNPLKLPSDGAKIVHIDICADLATVTFGRKLPKHGRDWGCSACFGTTALVELDFWNPTSRAEHTIVANKSGHAFESADQQCCTEVRQNRSARVLVSYTPDTDVSLCFNLNCAERWRYNAAKKQGSSNIDAGFRPVSLLLSNLLLTSTRGNRLAIWYLPSFSQEVQLP